MKITETYIVYSLRHQKNIKLHYATSSDGSFRRFYTEIDNQITQITIDEAGDLLKEY